MPDNIVPDKPKHECFPQPEDKDLLVWRYMDLAKFIWMLSNRKLWLSRLDLLQDPHEGSLPQLMVKTREEIYKNLGANQVSGKLSELNQQHRQSAYVNCWHAGSEESEAMWRLYCPGGLGVAIQMRYSELVASVAEDPYLYIGLVRYIDYAKQQFPAGNFYYPIMHKRISFSHEREVRLFKMKTDLWDLGTIGPDGIEVDWPIENLIAGIFINPYAPAYYADVVKSTVRAFAPALEQFVQWSLMRSMPAY